MQSQAVQLQSLQLAMRNQIDELRGEKEKIQARLGQNIEEARAMRISLESINRELAEKSNLICEREEQVESLRHEACLAQENLQ